MTIQKIALLVELAHLERLHGLNKQKDSPASTGTLASWKGDPSARLLLALM